MSSYVQHQSPPAPLFAGCPRRPSPRSAPRGRMDLNLFREHQAAFRAEFRPPFPIGPLTWGGVFIMFAFPPRTPPQPRSPIGLNSMPDCAPILGNLKRKCIIFFIHVCSEPKFTGWGRHQTDPVYISSSLELGCAGVRQGVRAINPSIWGPKRHLQTRRTQEAGSRWSCILAPARLGTFFGMGIRMSKRPLPRR